MVLIFSEDTKRIRAIENSKEVDFLGQVAQMGSQMWVISLICRAREPARRGGHWRLGARGALRKHAKEEHNKHGRK